MRPGERKAPNVELEPCSAVLLYDGTYANHELVNSAAAVTSCRHCGRTWAALDTELRARL